MDGIRVRVIVEKKGQMKGRKRKRKQEKNTISPSFLNCTTLSVFLDIINQDKKCPKNRLD